MEEGRPDSRKRDLASAGLILLGAVVLLALAVLAHRVLLIGFIGVMPAVLLSFPVGWLSRWLPRGLATVLAIFGGIGLTFGILTLGSQDIALQFHASMKRIPAAANEIEDWFSRIKRSQPVAHLPQGEQIANRLGDRLEKLVEAGLGATVPAAKRVLELGAAFILVWVLAAFFVSQPESYRSGLRKLVPKDREAVFDETYDRLGKGLRRWLGGILGAMLTMGAFTAVGLAVAGIKGWFILALLTFLGTFVPYLGAIASAIPGLLLALSQSPRQFIYALIVYIGVHHVEGYLVQPLIMKRAVEIRPAMLLLGQAVLAMLFGVPGVIITAPLLVCLQEAVQYLYVERRLGKRVERREELAPSQAA